MDNGQVNIQAPTYNDLYALVTQLRERLTELEQSNRESTPLSQSNTVNSSAIATPVVDYRMFPNLNQSVNVFNGRETTQEASTWYDTIVGLAELNGWPFNYRIQYIRSRLGGAALNWFTGRVFNDWSDFETQFKRVFVRLFESYVCRISRTC